MHKIKYSTPERGIIPKYCHYDFPRSRLVMALVKGN